MHWPTYMLTGSATASALHMGNWQLASLARNVAASRHARMERQRRRGGAGGGHAHPCPRPVQTALPISCNTSLQPCHPNTLLRPGREFETGGCLAGRAGDGQHPPTAPQHPLPTPLPTLQLTPAPLPHDYTRPVVVLSLRGRMHEWGRPILPPPSLHGWWVLSPTSPPRSPALKSGLQGHPAIPTPSYFHLQVT